MNFKKIFNWLPFLKKENDVKDTKQNTDKNTCKKNTNAQVVKYSQISIN